MEFSLEYIIASIFIFIGSIRILSKKGDNAPLKLLCFYLVASMIRPINGSHIVWSIELFFIFFISTNFLAIIKGNKCYLLFLFFSILSLCYSEDPLRGIPGFFMYVFPLFYYSLTNTAIKSIDEVDKLFSYISEKSWILLLLSITSVFYSFVFSYYGMAICMIPALLFFKTKKKKYIVHFFICLLPAIVMIKRTPLLGISVSMMIFAMLIYKWKAVIPSIFAIILAFVLIICIPQFKEKLFYNSDSVSMKDLTSSSDAVESINMNGRLVYWSIAWDKFYEKSPYWGVGQGTVKAYIQSNKNEYKDTFALMHNDWLLVLCEMGLIGFSLLLLFILNILRKCIKYSASKYPMNLRLMSAACAGSVVSTMIHMFFENCLNSFVFSISFVFYALLNLIIRKYRYNTII